MKKISKILVIAIIGLLLLWIGVSYYFHEFALKSHRGEKGRGAPAGVEEECDKYRTKDSVRDYWLNNSYQELENLSFDNKQLKAFYFKQNDSIENHKYAITVHGYNETHKSMAVYAKHYFDNGFNVLMPDNRGHGQSQGDYISMGWYDRLDIVNWINYIVKMDEKAEILLHGISMGGATVMMTSGEDLPKNVKVIVEDCGYSSVNDVFEEQLKLQFSWAPKGIVLCGASMMTKILDGFSFEEASALNQIKKNKTPMLLIHSTGDTFVPYRFHKPLFEACSSEKDSLIMPNAQHCMGVWMYPEKYWEKVDNFVKNYM